ncbi:MAG: hypothetical protein ACJ8J0_09190 [Longimicrobiaceae bacterium]
MSAPPDALRTDDTALRRALWRFEYGHLSDRRVKRLFRAAYLRATRDFAALEAGVPAVRRHDPALLAARDAFRARADDALRAERFRAALDAILRGRKTLAAMQALVRAATAIDQAAEALRRLHERARLPRLRALPCLQAPAELLAEARARMEQKRYAQAAYLAGASLAEAAPLERRERAAEGGRALEARLGEIRALCAETRALSGAGGADPASDGSLEVAAALARDGFVALAERMADELAFSLAARARLHRELRRAGAVSPADADLLRGAVAAGAGHDAWASATATLWRTRVEAGLRRVADQRGRVDRALARLGRVSPPGGRPSD